MDKQHQNFEGAGELMQLINANDQNLTGLLPRSVDWPDTLKTAYSISLNCGFPNAIYWGEKYLLLYNNEYSVILGDKHPAAFGKPVEEVYPEIWETLRPQLQSITINRQTANFGDTLFLLKRQGYLEECYFNYTLSPIFDANGHIVGIFNIALETTERRLALRRNETIKKIVEKQHFTLPLSECIHDCGIILQQATDDIPFYMTYIKSGKKHYKPVSASGIDPAIQGLHWPVDELIDSGTYQHIDDLSKVISQSIINSFREPCREAIIVPIQHDSCAVSGFLVCGLSPKRGFDQNYLNFIQSVGWHISACFSIATSFDQSRELEEEKENLLGVISHELKTPVTSIKGYTQIAVRELEKRGHSEAADLLRKMEKQIEKLGLIINDMMDGTNFKVGTVSFSEEKFDFDVMVKETVDIFRENTQQRISLNLNVQQSFKGDQRRLEQVVANLISNAIKYSPEDSEITITTNMVNQELMFSIQDEGIGIKPLELTKIFKRFYRAVNIKEYAYPGIGLGLFIVQQIVTHLGGKIWVDSTQDKGSTFHFSMPLC